MSGRVPSNLTVYLNLHGKHLSLIITIMPWPMAWWRWVNYTAYRNYMREESRCWGPVQWRWFDSRTPFPLEGGRS